MVTITEKILVTGATGAIGRNLVPQLRKKYGVHNVVVAYNKRIPQGTLAQGPSAQLNITNKERLREIIQQEHITVIYHLAALLSVAAEKNPELAKEVNTKGLQNVLDIMAEEIAKGHVMKGFWPSSIAVYGEGLPTKDVAEDVELKPITVYGRAKVEGEKAIEEFCHAKGVDMRIIRFPGINGPGKPGPGTTEYAIEMIQAAATKQPYTCPFRKDTLMPMMDMRDAIRSIILLMDAPTEAVDIGNAYNIDAFSFSPPRIRTRTPTTSS